MLLAGGLLALLLGLAGSPARASGAASPPPADTVQLTGHNADELLRAYTYALDPFAGRAAADPARAEALWRAGRFRPGPANDRPLNLGFRHQRLWLRVVVRNALPDRTRFVWSFYCFLDSAVLYRAAPKSSGRTVRLAGASARAVAAERAFPARSLSLPFVLGPGETAVLYARLDDYAGALYVPTDVTTAEDFLAWEGTYLTEWHWVWLLGFYACSAVLNLMLFGFLRDRIHLWYALYVALSTLFLLMEDGLAALVLPAGLHRAAWAVGQYNVLLLAAAVGLRILQLFIGHRAEWPRLYRAGTALSGAAAVFALAYAGLFPLALRTGGPAAATALNVTRETLLVFTAAYAIGALAAGARSRARRAAARTYALAYACFFGGGALFWLIHAGWRNSILVRPNELAWGLVLEMLLLNALLAGRFRDALRQAARLRIRDLSRRNTLSERLITAQEAEREKLGQELHDALGPGLMAVQLALRGRAVREGLVAAPAAAEAVQRAQTIAADLHTEVRALSHGWQPADLTREGLAGALAALVAAVNLRGTPHVQTHFDRGLADLPAPTQLAAYRIAAELLHNAVRHAHATTVMVQLLRFPDYLQLMVEDDGKGFETKAAGAGLGLRGVRARAAYVGGRVEIDSSGRGTVVTVTLPG